MLLLGCKSTSVKQQPDHTHLQTGQPHACKHLISSVAQLLTEFQSVAGAGLISPPTPDGSWCWGSAVNSAVNWTQKKNVVMNDAVLSGDLMGLSWFTRRPLKPTLE